MVPENSVYGCFGADSVDRRVKKEFVGCQNPAVAGGCGRQLNAAPGTPFEFTLRTSSGILPSHLKRRLIAFRIVIFSRIADPL